MRAKTSARPVAAQVPAAAPLRAMTSHAAAHTSPKADRRGGRPKSASTEYSSPVRSSGSALR